MDIPAHLLPQALPWGAHILYGLLLAAMLLRISRETLKEGLNRLLGCSVVLLVIWQLKAGITPGLSFHLLGMSFLTLAFGAPLALLGGTLVLLGHTLNGAGSLETFSLNALIMIALPIAVTQGILGLSRRLLPPNPFILIFINAFLAGALSMAAAVTAASLLLAAGSPYTLSDLAGGYLAFLPLVMLPEGWLNGLSTAILVGLRPAWIRTLPEPGIRRH